MLDGHNRDCNLWFMGVSIMKRLILFLLIGIPLSACVSHDNIRQLGAAGEAIGENVTVVSFNIRVGYGTGDWSVSPYLLRNRKKDLRPIIDTLQSINPDVVGLQEVLGRSQAKEIAKALDMNYAYAPHQIPWWGMAILSKYPITGCDSKFIGSKQGGSRTAIACKLGTKDLQIAAVNVHRDYRLFDGRSTKSAADFARKFKNVILIGDFNFPPNGPRYDGITETFLDTALVDTANASKAREAGTYGFPLGRRIDYIFVRETEYETLDAGVADYKFRHASDHRAYFAKLRRR